MPPSQLQIATGSLQRLVREEASYHKEMVTQEKRIAEMKKQESAGEPEEEAGNRAYLLKQEQKALEETKAVFPSMRERIANAREKLQAQLGSGGGSEQEIEKAKEVLKSALEAQKNDPDSSDKVPV